MPPNFSDEMDTELWTMAKKCDESMLEYSVRFRESARKFAQLPIGADVLQEVHLCRYFKRGMPASWQDKLAASGAVY